jgi:ComF family protein
MGGLGMALLASTAARRLVDPVLAVVFPSACPACGAGLAQPTRGPLCEACWSGLPRHRGGACACGVPLSDPTPECARCRRGLSPISSGTSLGPYAGALRTLVHELKYRGRRRVAARLAEVLVAEPAVAGLLRDAEALVPVPMHPRRRRQRGFNQAELLAQELARRCGVPLVPDALVRRRDTATQTGLSAAARRRNVAGAFAVRRRARVAGRTLVLVDDVVTTAATALACARALRAAGACDVRLLSVARALVGE